MPNGDQISGPTKARWDQIRANHAEELDTNQDRPTRPTPPVDGRDKILPVNISDAQPRVLPPSRARLRQLKESHDYVDDEISVRAEGRFKPSLPQVDANLDATSTDTQAGDSSLDAFRALLKAACCFPDCEVRVLSERGTLNVESSHINALHPGGPRYDPTLTREEVLGSENLLILCRDHHALIDRDPNKYSSAVLHQWRRRVLPDSLEILLQSENEVPAGREKSPLQESTREDRTIFLCHSSGDKAQVGELYAKLSLDGHTCWLDEEDLLGGQDFDREITLAIEGSQYVIACISKSSITRRGYLQKELKKALDVADQQPEGAVFLIPVRLEETEIPMRLRHLHCIDLFRPGGYGRLLKSLGRRN